MVNVTSTYTQTNNRLTAFGQGLPGSVGTSRNNHLLTPIQIIGIPVESWAGMPTHTHTHTVLSWPAASLQSTARCAITTIGRASHSPQTRVLSFDTLRLLSPLCLHRGMPGSTSMCTPIHSRGGGPHVAAWVYNTAAAAAAVGLFFLIL